MKTYNYALMIKIIILQIIKTHYTATYIYPLKIFIGNKFNMSLFSFLKNEFLLTLI